MKRYRAEMTRIEADPEGPLVLYEIDVIPLEARVKELEDDNAALMLIHNAGHELFDQLRAENEKLKSELKDARNCIRILEAK